MLSIPSTLARIATDAGDDQDIGLPVVPAIVFGGAVITLVLLALWAIGKPTHPDACDDYRGAECVAAIAESQ